MIDLFLLLLRPALLCVDGGSRKPHHISAALIAFVLDLIIARTTWRLIAGQLHPGERTISDSLFWFQSQHCRMAYESEILRLQYTAEFRAVRDIALTIKDH